MGSYQFIPREGTMDSKCCNTCWIWAFLKFAELVILKSQVKNAWRHIVYQNKALQFTKEYKSVSAYIFFSWQNFLKTQWLELCSYRNFGLVLELIMLIIFFAHIHEQKKKLKTSKFLPNITWKKTLYWNINNCQCIHFLNITKQPNTHQSLYYEMVKCITSVIFKLLKCIPIF